MSDSIYRLRPQTWPFTSQRHTRRRSRRTRNPERALRWRGAANPDPRSPTTAAGPRRRGRPRWPVAARRVAN